MKAPSDGEKLQARSGLKLPRTLRALCTGGACRGLSCTSGFNSSLLLHCFATDVAPCGQPAEVVTISVETAHT